MFSHLHIIIRWHTWSNVVSNNSIPTVLKIRTICHVPDLWKIARSCKKLHSLYPPDPLNLPGAALIGRFRAPEELWDPPSGAVHCFYPSRVWCLHDEMFFDLQNIHERHSIALPTGRDMGCILRVQCLLYALLQSEQCCMQYRGMMDRVLAAPGCTCRFLFTLR